VWTRSSDGDQRRARTNFMTGLENWYSIYNIKVDINCAYYYSNIKVEF
jgi:hypothetical protein